MKKQITLLAMLLLAFSIIAQSPEKMSYQAVVFDASNNLVIGQDIGMQISLIQGTMEGSVVYTETHSPTTNTNGIVSLEIGTGTSNDDFSSIDWSDGPYYIKTETDPTQEGGTNYTISGISQLISVPFALHAKTAESATESDPIFTEAVASAITTADTANWNGKLESESDPIYSASAASGITTTDTANWNSKLNSESDPLFSAWDKSTGIEITEEQITDLDHFTNEDESDPVFSAWDKDYDDLTNKPSIVNSQWTSTEDDIYFSSGKVGIGTDSPSPSAILELNSNTKGFLPPRLSSTERDAISGLTPGLMIYNTTENKLQSVNPSGEGLTLDQSNESHTTYSTMNYQSFTAGISGKLSKVSFRVSNPKSDGTGTVKLMIYEGEKIEGGNLVDGDVLLGESAPIVPEKNYTTWCDFDFSSLNISLTAGQQYTFKLTTSIEEITWIAYDNSNAYAGGRSKLSSSWDLLFKTYMAGYEWTDVQSTASNNTLSQGKLLIGNASDEAAEQAISGDVTISETGVTAIGASKVTNDMLAGSISNDKLAGSITNDKLAGSITNDKLANPTQWTTASSNIYYNSGLVGIGTSSPSAKLHIQGAGVSSDFRISRDPAAAPNYYTYITAPGDTPGRSFIGVNDTENSSAVLTMTSEGKLGVNVGNADPVATLQVRDATGSLSATKDISAEIIRHDGTYNPRLQIRHSTSGTDINNTYSTGAANLSFSTGDVEAMRIDGNRNVGIGTTTPSSKLEVHDKIIAGNGTSTNGTTVLECRYAQSSGDVVNSLGTMYSSGAWFMGYGMRPKTGSYGHVSSADNSTWERTGLELSNSFFKLHHAPAQSTTVGSDITGLTTPFYVDLATTKVGIGTTAMSYTLHVNGSVAGTSAYNNLSDARLKKDVTNISNGLEKVLALRPITFNWKQEAFPDKTLDDRNHLGFIAQEVEEVLPQAVSTADDEMKTKSIAYGDIVPVLTKAIQEQQATIEAQQKQIDELKMMLNALMEK